tara:strand:- start:1900 stop:2319 length:420 start_codon:yes stop_codon:yes gene_type:complete
MVTFNYTVEKLDQLNEVASKLISLIPKKKIFIFEGDMGSGKTTLIKKTVKELGVEDACSPTFSIINTYLGLNNQEIFHIDCYRIEQENEAENIGLVEIINEENICFIEWPKKIHNLLPNNCVKVNIEVKDNLRKILIQI